MRKKSNFILLSTFIAVVIFSWLAFQQDTVRQNPKVYYNISKLGQDTVFAGQYVKKGQELVDAGLLDSARNCFYKALEVYEKIPDIESDSTILTYKLNALFWAGFVSEQLNDLSTGEKYLKTCIDLATKHFTTKHYVLSFAYTKLGYIYFDRGDRYKAYELIKQAYQIRSLSMHDSTIWMFNAHGNMEWICGVLGKYDEAEYHINKLFEVAQKYHCDNPEYILSAYLRFARLYGLEGQEEKQLYYQELAKKLDTFKLPPDHPGNLENHRLMINKYFKEKDYEAAIQLIPQSIKICEKSIGFFNPTTTEFLHFMAEAFQKSNQADSALFYFQHALITMLPEMQGADYLEVPKNIEPQVNMFTLEALRRKANVMKWYYDNCDKDLRYLESCLGHQLAAIKLMDTKRTNFLTIGSSVGLNEEFFSIFEDALLVCLHLHEVTNDSSYLKTAFYIVEKSKAMALLETVRATQLNASTLLPDAAKQQEYELKSNIAYHEKLLTSEKSKADSLKSHKRIRDLSQQLFELNLTYDSLVDVFKQDFPTYFYLKHNNSVATTDAVQRHLSGKNTALIEYFVGDSTLAMFIFTPTEFYVHSQRIDSTFIGQVGELKSILDGESLTYQKKTDDQIKADFEQFTQLSGHLFQTLLQPALAHTDACKLVIVPDGVLGYLPFEVLLTKPSSPENYNYRSLPYLFLEKATSYEFSSTLLLEPRAKQGSSSLYAGFAPSYEGDELLASRGEDSLVTSRVYEGLFRDNGLENLQYNQDEIKEVGAMTSGATFLGSQAQEQSFLNEAGKARILHLAMHALTNDQEPSFSQLIFSLPNDTVQDGKLHVYELCNLQLNAELAVLSACRSGTGKLRRGEGIMSFSRAFKSAGCPNIVMSLWRANDFSTKEIIADFFRNLKLGQDKDVALQQARKSFLLDKASETMTHPSYWATFVLIGDDKPIEIGVASWLWWAAVVLLAAIATWVIVRVKQARRQAA